jgi:dipeptidyl aminopeptidase/acylaminoacyl peptidase
VFVALVDGYDLSLRQLTLTSADHMLPAFSPDGSRLACLRAATALDSPTHGRVCVLPSDADGTEAAALTMGLDRNCAPYPASRAPQWDGDDLWFLVEDGGRTHLWSVAADGSRAPAAVVADHRTLTGFDRRNGTLAFVALSPDSLPEVWVRAGGAERRLTDFTAALTENDRRIATPVRFVATSCDGTEVECWAIEPEHAPGARVPTLLNIHGGPFTQYGDKFFDEFQYEVGAGFGVVFCNPRGSSGYTEAWGRAIRWPECEVDPGSGWGGVDHDDVMACIETAVERFDWIDPERLGVMGGSYGGYMTSWIVGHSDRFAAAVSERSVNNLLTEEHNSDIAGSFVGYVGVRHIANPEPYLRQSPITYVEQMRTPLLILHSENDLRCPINQAEELFIALRLLGRTPEFVRVPGESHELTRSGAPRHRQQRAEIILDFFGRHLRGWPYA